MNFGPFGYRRGVKGIKRRILSIRLIRSKRKVVDSKYVRGYISKSTDEKWPLVAHKVACM